MADDSKKFYGLITAADPTDLPPGAATTQLNLICEDAGRLTSRGGCRELMFSNQTARVVPADPDTIADIVAMYCFFRPEGNVVVYQDTGGNIRAARSPM